MKKSKKGTKEQKPVDLSHIKHHVRYSKYAIFTYTFLLICTGVAVWYLVYGPGAVEPDSGPDPIDDPVEEPPVDDPVEDPIEDPIEDPKTEPKPEPKPEWYASTTFDVLICVIPVLAIAHAYFSGTTHRNLSIARLGMLITITGLCSYSIHERHKGWDNAVTPKIALSLCVLGICLYLVGVWVDVAGEIDSEASVSLELRDVLGREPTEQEVAEHIEEYVKRFWWVHKELPADYKMVDLIHNVYKLGPGIYHSNVQVGDLPLSYDHIIGEDTADETDGELVQSTKVGQVRSGVVDQILTDMDSEFGPNTYHLTHHNCNDFAEEFFKRVEPSYKFEKYINRLARFQRHFSFART